jgi:RecA/RadA recombinase
MSAKEFDPASPPPPLILEEEAEPGPDIPLEPGHPDNPVGVAAAPPTRPRSRPRIKPVVVEKQKHKQGRSLLDAIVAGLNRRRPTADDGGTFEIQRTSKIVLTRIKHVLMTGNPAFDRLTGGLPFGRLIEVYGMDNSGKTALAKLAAVNAQLKNIYERIFDEVGKVAEVKKVDPNEVEVVVVYIDNENSVNDDGTIEFVNPNKLEKQADGTYVAKTEQMDIGLGHCDTVDQMFKMVDTTIDLTADHIKAEKKLRLEEAKKTGKKPAPDKEVFIVIIVDTIAGTASKEEMAQEWGKSDYSRQPKELRQGFRRLTRQLQRFNVCMICVNQVGTSMRGGGGGGRGGKQFAPREEDYIPSGGLALKYWASLRIFMYQVPVKWTMQARSRFQDGFLLGFFTKKNRTVKPLRTGRLALLFGPDEDHKHGLDPIMSMLETLIFLGFATVNKTSKEISFRFNSWNVPMTTFGATNSRAEAAAELEDERGLVKNPSIESRLEWMEFYAEHKADLDKMFEAAMEYAFATEGLSTTRPSDDSDPDFGGDDEIQDLDDD